MSFKNIFAKAFGIAGRNKPSAAPSTSSPEPVSPYARLLESELTQATPAANRRGVKDTFLLESLTAWPLSTVAMFYPDQGIVVMRDPYRGTAGRMIRWSAEGMAFPLYGDWCGHGAESIGFYHRPSRYFFLWAGEQDGDSAAPDIEFPFGPPDSGWLPVVGDWDGDGKHGVGFYDPERGVFMLRNSLSAPALPEVEFPFACPALASECLPLAGDWNGDGKDGVGLYHAPSGMFYLKDQLSQGSPDHSIRFAPAGESCVPLAGDWNGDGSDGIACFHPASNTFFLRDRLSSGEPEARFTFGARETPGIPFAGRWSAVELRPQSGETPMSSAAGTRS